MMIFNSFTVANDYNFGAQWPNGRLIFLPTNKTFEGICLAFGEISSKGVVNSLFNQNHSVEKKLLNLVLSLFMNNSAK